MYFDINFLLILNLQQDGTELFNFVDGHQSWPDYLRNMAADGTCTWGDHVILHAAANCFKTCIHVISSLSHDLTICPEHDVGSSSPLVLGHLHDLHYVSLKPGIVTCTHIKQWILTRFVYLNFTLIDIINMPGKGGPIPGYENDHICVPCSKFWYFFLH